MPSVTDILTIAKISQYLASNDIANGALFGKRTNPMLPIQLYIVRKSVQWRYDMEDVIGGNAPSASLTNTANYLYKLCDRYGLYALSLVVSGGIVPGVVPSAPIFRLPYIGIAGRGVPDNDPEVGASTVTSTKLIGLGANSLNYGDIQIFVNTVPMQNFGNNPNFTYDPVAGTIDISPLTWAEADSIYVDRNQ